MPEPLKNIYTPVWVRSLADALHETEPAFDPDAFTALVFDHGWNDRELKQRMRHLTLSLRTSLPGSYREALDVLRSVAPRFTGLPAFVFPDFVEVYGPDDPDVSLPALEYFTQFSTSEFAIRPFIRRDPERLMQQMLLWAHSDNHHVRRLASEGCRPRLPWAMALPEFKKDPSPVLPVLEHLKADASEYVRRSVANNLNDISRDHPALVLDIARRWLGACDETDRLVRHACRTLLKRGNAEALALFGLQDDVDVAVHNLALSRTELSIGDKVELAFDLTVRHDAPLKLRIEYGVDFVKSGGAVSRKIFRMAEKIFPAGETVRLRRSHSFRNLTTRKHYAGRHGIVVLVNGRQKAETACMLAAD